jgi:hypothetical protein
MWRSTLGTTVDPYAGADGDGDGIIGDGDYILWRANFGSAASATAAAFRSKAIPEPTSLVLAMAIVVGCVLLNSRRHP